MDSILFPQFIDHFTSSSSFKAKYFAELSKYRIVRPTFEYEKRKGRSFSSDNNFLAEVKASVQYRTAKAKGIILVSQTW